MSLRDSAIAVASLLLLAGCASGPPIGSVVGAECQIVHTPGYAVRGATNYDKAWVNTTTEALVVGCRQPRPKARPASFDAPPAVIKAPRNPSTLRKSLNYFRKPVS